MSSLVWCSYGVFIMLNDATRNCSFGVMVTLFMLISCLGIYKYLSVFILNNVMLFMFFLTVKDYLFS